MYVTCQKTQSTKTAAQKASRSCHIVQQLIQNIFINICKHMCKCCICAEWTFATNWIVNGLSSPVACRLVATPLLIFTNVQRQFRLTFKLWFTFFRSFPLLFVILYASLIAVKCSEIIYYQDTCADEGERDGHHCKGIEFFIATRTYELMYSYNWENEKG